MQKDELALFFSPQFLSEQHHFSSLLSNCLSIHLYISSFVIMASKMPTPPKPVASPSGYASNFDKAERALSEFEPSTPQCASKSSTFSTTHTYTEKPLLSHTNTESKFSNTNLRPFVVTSPQSRPASQDSPFSDLYSSYVGSFPSHPRP